MGTTRVFKIVSPVTRPTELSEWEMISPPTTFAPVVTTRNSSVIATAGAETPALVGLLTIKEAAHNVLFPNYKSMWKELLVSKEPSDGTGGKPELGLENSRMRSCTSRPVMVESREEMGFYCDWNQGRIKPNDAHDDVSRQRLSPFLHSHHPSQSQQYLPSTHTRNRMLCISLPGVSSLTDPRAIAAIIKPSLLADYPFQLDTNTGNTVHFIIVPLFEFALIDFRLPKQIGVGWIQATVGHGEHCSSATTYVGCHNILIRSYPPTSLVQPSHPHLGVSGTLPSRCHPPQRSPPWPTRKPCRLLLKFVSIHR